MKILVCPLNWGLGHATRCVPIIRRLIAEGHEVVLVSDGYPLEFLRQEFPSLRIIEYPSYPVCYARGKSQVGAMLFNLPNILKGILREHNWLDNLLHAEHFDQVISDNRFGMWNKKVHAVYMTHQLMVKMPPGLKLLEPIAWLIHRLFIHRYDACWIPDTPEDGGLSGDLSHKYPLPKNATFIGTLSRFQGMEHPDLNTEYEVVVVISGIEPQRTILEESMLERFENAKHKTLLVTGQPQNEQKETYRGPVTIVPHLQDAGLSAAFLGARKIISRSGYSTIMDLAALNCLNKAEFIPTPGQTEQEYLSDYILNRGTV
ncbi:MAG: glycosyltransferase [Bacteroidota bacterium]|nr:glycosyltransferase [Bacteroidota bacterium]